MCREVGDGHYGFDVQGTHCTIFMETVVGIWYASSGLGYGKMEGFADTICMSDSDPFSSLQYRPAAP